MGLFSLNCALTVLKLLDQLQGTLRLPILAAVRKPLRRLHENRHGLC